MAGEKIRINKFKDNIDEYGGKDLKQNANYIIYPTGKIVNKITGYILPYILEYNTVKVMIPSKNKSKKCKRELQVVKLIISHFIKPEHKNYVIKYMDGDNTNCNISNIKLIYGTNFTKNNIQLKNIIKIEEVFDIKVDEIKYVPYEIQLPEIKINKSESKSKNTIKLKKNFKKKNNVNKKTIEGRIKTSYIKHGLAYEENYSSRYISEYPGVHFNNSRNKWCACINLSGHQVVMGPFCSELDAYNHYKKIYNEYFTN